jgi:hypothetical protein
VNTAVFKILTDNDSFAYVSCRFVYWMWHSIHSYKYSPACKCHCINLQLQRRKKLENMLRVEKLKELCVRLLWHLWNCLSILYYRYSPISLKVVMGINCLNDDNILLIKMFTSIIMILMTLQYTICVICLPLSTVMLFHLYLSTL